MEVTELGRETLVKESQWENAESPMVVTESGMETLVKESQWENA